MRKTIPILLAALLCVGTAEARIPRSTAAKNAFVRTHRCPSTNQYRLPCPGYVIDHRIPLCAGGRDDPSNMAWQEYRASLEKDKKERQLCAAMRRKKQ